MKTDAVVAPQSSLPKLMVVAWNYLLPEPPLCVKFFCVPEPACTFIDPEP